MLKGLSLLALRALPLFLLATPAWAADALYINSDGQSLTYTDSQGTFTINGKASGAVSVSFQKTDDFFNSWSFEFQAPTGSSMALGNYDGAERDPFQGPLQPGVDYSVGDSGCDFVSGRFVVQAITIDVNNNVTSLAVDFQLFCDGSTVPLIGAIRYNNTLPYPLNAPSADAGANQIVMQGANVTIDGSLSEPGNGSITAYSWTQLSGPTVTLADPSAATTSFTAPAVPLGGSDVILQLEVDNSLSLSSTSNASIHVANPADPTTLLYVTSAQGKTATVTPLQSPFTATTALNNGGTGVQITVTSSAFNSWTLDFLAPQGQALQVGTSYDNAQSYPSQIAGTPAMAVSGPFGCTDAGGRFVILDLQKDGNGNITSFAADAAQECGNPLALTETKIRYNSTVPLDEPWADAGTEQLVTQDVSVTLNAAGSDAGGSGENITSYQWTQLSGTPVSLSDDTVASPMFTAPDVGAGGEDFTFQLTITNSDGLTSTDTVTVHVANPADPVTALQISSDPGDNAGQGQDVFLNSLSAIFTRNKIFSDIDDGGGVSFTVRNTANNYWGLNFTVPVGQSLHDGTYSLAQAYPFEASGVPGISVSYDGNDCFDTGGGQFTVLDVQTDGSGNVTSFAADFWQTCDDSHYLRGKIRYNSTVSIYDPSADAGQYQWVRQGDTTALSGGASDPGGAGVSITSYQWTQLSGPGVTLSDPTAEAPTFTAPAVPLAGSDLTFQLTVTNSLGLTSSATVTVHVANPADPAPFSALYTISDAGDPVGQGLTASLDSTQATFALANAASNGVNGVNVTITGPTNNQLWDVELAPPTGQILQAGTTYKLAERYPFEGPIAPGLSVLGPGFGCDIITGRFAILDVRYDKIGNILSLAADFEQHCEGIVPALHGTLRYNSGIAVTTPFADAGLSQYVTQGSSVALDGSASYTGGGNETLVSYAWTQLSGPRVTLSGAATAAPTFTAPVVSAGGGNLVFQLTVTNSDGLSGSDTVTVHVANPADPVSVLYMTSDAGDPVGGGQTISINPLLADFTASQLSPGVSVQVGSDSSNGWTLDFAPPQGQTLQMGISYDLAEIYPDQSSLLPGLSVFGGSSNCSSVTGRFQVLDIQLSSGSTVTSFAADFVQYCNGSTAALHGKIRYNSTVPLDTPFADAGDPQTVVQGSTVTLSAGGTDAGGSGESITSYQWTQLSGTPVSLSGAATASPTFTAPDVGDGGADLTFQVTVTNSDGLTSTTTITVHVTQPGAPKSTLNLQSDAGDTVGSGLTTNLNPELAVFTATGTASSIQVGVNGGELNDWTLDFVAPQGQTLQVGQTYALAQGLSSLSTTVPGLSVSTPGHSCGSLTGQFTVRDLVIAQDGSITSFAADFVQRCNGNPPGLFGWIRYNSTVPMDGVFAVAGPVQTTFPEFPVTLDGSGSHVGPAGTASYTWTQVVAKGDPVVEIAPLSGAKALFSAPDVPPGGHTLTFQLTVSDGDGHTGTDTVKITDSNETDPKTVFYYESDPGDPVGQGTSSFDAAPDLSMFQFFSGGIGEADIEAIGQALPPALGVWTLSFDESDSSQFRTGTFSALPFSIFNSSIAVANQTSVCSSPTGFFIVRDLGYNKQGRIANLGVDFVQHCAGATGDLRGALRYNSKTPILINEPTANPGPDQNPTQAGTITLDGSTSFPGWGTIVSTQWRQVNGTRVTLANANTPIASFNLPEKLFANGGSALVFQLTVKNSLGLSSTGNVTITAKEPTTVSLTLQSDAGDPIGNGWSATYEFANTAVKLQSQNMLSVSTALSGDGDWTLDFASPVKQTLADGTYPNAILFKRTRSPSPEMDVSTAAAQCKTVTGSFTVLDVLYGMGDKIDSLAVDFVQHCDGIGPALHGKFRYHSAVP